MRSKRPFRSLIVCVSCAMVGCILASTAYSRRVDELEIERDIYASRFQNWQTRAIDAEENVGRLQTEVDNLTAELNAQTDLTLTYAGSFSCTAYCAEEYAHICGEGHGITSSGAKVQPGDLEVVDLDGSSSEAKVEKEFRRQEVEFVKRVRAQTLGRIGVAAQPVNVLADQNVQDKIQLVMQQVSQLPFQRRRT